MPRKQIWSGAVLAAVAASSLTGCSLKASDGTPQSFGQLSALSPRAAIQAATRAVTAHPSAKVHTVLATASASQTSDVVATFGERPTLQGTLAQAAGTPTGGTGQSSPAIPIRYADDTLYMQMGQVPALAAQMNGKSWLKMDLQAMAEDPNTSGSVGTDVLENTSPSKGLTLLAAAKDLHAVGAEQRGGVQAEHYAGALTGADATDPNLVGRGLTQEDTDVVANALAQGQVTKLGYDVWLRADGLPVAMTFTEVTPGGTLTGEIDYSDWGTPVDVAAVPDTQSADYMAMVKQEEAAQASASPSGAASGAPSSSAGAPATPSTPSTPSTPATPSAPSTPSTPAAPSTPSAPGTPATPSAPTPTGASSSSSAVS